MKYRCLVCEEINECSENTSGVGVCPKCTPGFLERFKKLPKRGKIEDLPKEFSLCPPADRGK